MRRSLLEPGLRVLADNAADALFPSTPYRLIPDVPGFVKADEDMMRDSGLDPKRPYIEGYADAVLGSDWKRQMLPLFAQGLQEAGAR